MKKRSLIVTGIFTLFACIVLNAQIEVKINPIGAIFGSPDVSVEYGVNESFGVEGTILMDFSGFKVDGVEYRNLGLGGRVAGKYYFKSKHGFDKWHTGLYTKYRSSTGKVSDSSTSSSEEIKSTRMAVGVLFGHKWVTKHNLVFDLNAGLGRAFISTYENTAGDSVSTADIPFLNWDGLFTFAVGYRFGGKKK